MTTAFSTDVLIIGGGTMGLAIAIELALNGAKPTILTRSLDEAALYAAAGMLAPQAEQLAPGPMLELCLASRDLYPEWIHKLEHLSQLETGYWPCGIIAPVYRASESREPALAAQWLTPEQVAIRQPGLAEKVQGAWWYPADGQVDNRALAKVLLAAAIELEIHIKHGTTVTEFLTQDQQITGLATPTGIWSADQYVLANGAWSQSVLPIPVTPRKGQMLSLKYSPEKIRPLDHVIFAPEVYLVPRQTERIVIGATSENVGFKSGNTAQGVQHLLNAAIALCPGLAELTLEEVWWGFRPVTPDELPILGRGAWDNLWLATGHYRNGILLAPITAQLISQGILTRSTDLDLTPFSYQRFQE